jgi:ElaB/YqjD/DUF883 family membrane-anchored ribosome-binding protein
MLGRTKDTDIDGKGIIRGVMDMAEQGAKATFAVEKLKTRASHALEDSVDEAKRMIKKGKYAAEDLMDDTAHRIKHEPFRAVGMSFGVGIGLGLLTGCLLTYRTMKKR